MQLKSNACFLQLCVRSMASLETIGPLMAAMKVRADMAGVACEALNRMFQKEQTDLVAQVFFLLLPPTTTLTFILKAF